MLKITAIGNLTNDVELKVSETTGHWICLAGTVLCDGHSQDLWQLYGI